MMNLGLFRVKTHLRPGLCYGEISITSVTYVTCNKKYDLVLRGLLGLRWSAYRGGRGGGVGTCHVVEILFVC